MPLPESQGAIVRREGGATLVTGAPYLAHGVSIPAIETFYVKDAKPKADGPWIGEADKVAWRDEATGYECIMLRSSTGGHLGGYVGVPASHPLHGFDRHAIPSDLGIEVHGGITYSRMCEEGPSPDRRIIREAYRICHVPQPPMRYAPTTHATDYRVEDANVWWFGFECDHIADLSPTNSNHAERAAAAGIAQVYRDDQYAFNEVTDLAAQLRAVAEGVPVPPRSRPPLPAMSIDPGRGS